MSNFRNEDHDTDFTWGDKPFRKVVLVQIGNPRNRQLGCCFQRGIHSMINDNKVPFNTTNPSQCYLLMEGKYIFCCSLFNTMKFYIFQIWHASKKVNSICSTWNAMNLF